MRLDRAISHAGWGSRAEIRRMAASGRISADGVVVTNAAAEVNPAVLDIRLDGFGIDYAEHYWIMMNKPDGVVSATEDAKNATVVSLLDERYRRMGLFPAGRLDKDSTGLIILTTDGQKAHAMLSPKRHVPKLYRVTVDGEPGQREIDAFAGGIVLADGQTLRPAKLEIVAPSECMVTLEEGKYHQIKKMFASLGFRTLSLHRLSIGGLILDASLPPGGWRRMNEDEIDAACDTSRST